MRRDIRHYADQPGHSSAGVKKAAAALLQSQSLAIVSREPESDCIGVIRGCECSDGPDEAVPILWMNAFETSRSGGVCCVSREGQNLGAIRGAPDFIGAGIPIESVHSRCLHRQPCPFLALP